MGSAWALGTAPLLERPSVFLVHAILSVYLLGFPVGCPSIALLSRCPRLPCSTCWAVFLLRWHWCGMGRLPQKLCWSLSEVAQGAAVVDRLERLGTPCPLIMELPSNMCA